MFPTAHGFPYTWEDTNSNYNAPEATTAVGVRSSSGPTCGTRRAKDSPGPLFRNEVLAAKTHAFYRMHPSRMAAAAMLAWSGIIGVDARHIQVPKLVASRDLAPGGPADPKRENLVVGRPQPAGDGDGDGRIRHSLLHVRQSVGRCGPDFDDQECDTGYCCSSAAWCGQGYSYCSSPACMINYSDSCDSQLRPEGTDTSSIVRDKVGPVPYGSAIYHCSRPGDIALTYDDGPWDYTEDLLDMLKAYGARATFYITGNNLGKGMINDDNTEWPALIRRMIDEGHQIASHTWGHQRMSLLTGSQLREGMIYNEIALNNILGPPYSDCNAACEDIMDDLGYHITYFNLDTEGYLHNTEQAIQTSRDIWDARVEPAGPEMTQFLHIEHDPVYWSVYSLTEHMLESIKTNGWRAVTVGDCLEDSPENWYRAGDGTAPAHTSIPTPTPPAPSSTATGSGSGSSGTPSPTTSIVPGRCGPDFGNVVCGTGYCCSQHGWCGTSDDHCNPDTGCQSLYGQCDGDETPISQDGRCGQGEGDAFFRTTCTGYQPAGVNTIPGCCSEYGWCGSSEAHCSPSNGCQALYGSCT
ncbi:putative peptidoglycan-N-acetylglucosamine deacetylase [Zalerion maritima]|uniref:Peptidoglycan-N-acetylglucosamine deacetylase n=1 Tax=Zalerion maritima TaxID=339359 RepID=A0AAD5RLM5_9PEZI|nr:putative peptidoglycan-N-acetylglucosamine deacetylase [Zalerion maritima]